MNARLRTSVHAFTFFLTGIGTAILGATLPATLHIWSLNDSRGGVLLLAAWGGSTAGALLARGTGETSAALGLVLSAASLFLLSLPQPPALVCLYFLYGLGLGATMTSISLLRSREVTPSRADIELNRLNLLWAAGAVLAPSLAERSLEVLSVTSAFRFLALCFAGGSVAFLATSIRTISAVPNQVSAIDPSSKTRPLPWAPLRFGLFAAACVGLESAIGSWLTTYAQRSTLAVADTLSANSAFWAGLLLSRAAHSLTSVKCFHTRLARISHILAVGTGILLLILLPYRSLILAAAALCGLGLGPLYPFVLSVSLPRFRSAAVFVLAGMGASLVPWLTGALSSALGSLRLGLLAPATAFLLLLIVAFAMRTELT